MFENAAFEMSLKLTLHDGKLDVTDRDTVVALAVMAKAAYTRGDASPVDNLTVVEPFGRDTAGVRGYVFGSVDQTLIIIVYKGTSISLLGLIPLPDSIPTNLNDQMEVCFPATQLIFRITCFLTVAQRQIRISLARSTVTMKHRAVVTTRALPMR
jgi:putative lipase involved disintegration of autophagic bodies